MSDTGTPTPGKGGDNPDNSNTDPGNEPNSNPGNDDKNGPNEPNDKGKTDPPRNAETVEHWRDLAREWETRAKRNQTQLDKLQRAQMSDAERAAADLNDARREATEARAETIRYRVAARHGITDADAELFLTGTDEETVERQATRLTERTPTKPKPDPSQGARDADPKASPEQQFSDLVGGMFT